jgi:hypothetical protein
MGSRWCVAASKSSNYFNSYDNRGTKLYYVISKRLHPVYKLTVVGNSVQWHCHDGHNMSREDLKVVWPSLSTSDMDHLVMKSLKTGIENGSKIQSTDDYDLIYAGGNDFELVDKKHNIKYAVSVEANGHTVYWDLIDHSMDRATFTKAAAKIGWDVK